MASKKIIFISIASIVIVCTISLWLGTSINGTLDYDPDYGYYKDGQGYTAFNISEMVIIWETQPELEALPELLIEMIHLDESTVQQVATSAPFKIPANMQFYQANWYDTIELGAYINDGKGYPLLGLFPSGAIRYYTPEWSGQNSFAPILPSEAEAKQIADNFLSEVQKSGAFFPTGEQQLVFSEVVPGSQSSDAWGNLYTNYWNVRYNVEYNGIPVGGHYGVTVSVGAGGQIVAFNGNWRNLVPSGDNVNITVTPQQALESCPPPVIRGTPVSFVSMTVQDVKLVYYCDVGILHDLDSLSAVYEFTVVLTDTNGQQIQSVIHAKATA